MEIDRAMLVDEDRPAAECRMSFSGCGGKCLRAVPCGPKTKTGGYNEANKKRGAGLCDGLPGLGSRFYDCDPASKR
jgi:hypothetical protein